MSDEQNVLNEQYRQPETVQLSPDAIVFINGSNMLLDPEGKEFDIRQDITDIATSLSTDQVPGTASFTISYPEHSGGRKGISKYKNLMIMSEVTIYFRGRFLKEDKEKKKKYPYYQAFWGLITAITENYNDGVHTISVSCVDILRWWAISNITINPSLLASTESLKTYLVDNLHISEEDALLFMNGEVSKDAKQGRTISIFSNIFSNKTIPEILQACCCISMLQMMPMYDNLVQQAKAVTVGKDLRDKLNNGITLSQMSYWAERLNNVGRSLRIYGLTKRQIYSTKDRLDINISKIVKGAGVTENAGSATVFYQMFPNAPSVAKSDRKSQLEIANEIKEAIHFEFFMDVNGDIVFKPPFYNLDVRKNTPNSYLNDVDILNWNFVQSESEVVTRMDVTGSLSNVSSGNLAAPTGIAFDPLLQLQFGERPQQRNMPWLMTTQQCFFWARAELARQNALIRQGTVTIIGRPELRLGYPVYIPSRDAFYYVKGIEHRFTFGGTFTTNLTLVAERRRTDTKLGLFRNVGALEDRQVAEPGKSNAAPIENNNFVKQIFSPSICTPRTKEHIEIVEPNFTINVNKTKSQTQGQWKTFSDAVAEKDKEEFQISDSDGYEVIGQIGSEPYVTYGYKEELSSKNSIDTTTNKTEASDSASKALTLDVKKNELVVDPNNSIVTLDDINSRMEDYGSTGSKNSASKAQGIDGSKL